MKEIYYDFDDNEFLYEADEYRLNEYIETLFENEYSVTKEQAQRIIENFDLYESLEEIYEEQIKDFFEDLAYEEYVDSCEYRKDPLGYYGISNSDFI